MEMLTKKLAVLLIFLMLLGLPCVQAEEIGFNVYMANCIGILRLFIKMWKLCSFSS